MNSKKLAKELAFAIMDNSSYPDSILLVNTVHALFMMSEGRLEDANSDIEYIKEFANK